MTTYSKNEQAERLLGTRDLPRNSVPIDQPCERGYHCPVCKYELYNEKSGVFDERLHWSEYNGMLWCSKCNVDYPSCLCQPDPQKAVEVFLATVKDAVARQDQITRHACAETVTAAMCMNVKEAPK
jgi:hypothetical protein